MTDSGSDYGSVLSASQHKPTMPLSLSKSTMGSIAQRTSWRSNEEGSSPASYSSKTRSTTLNFDDTPTIQPPSSDKGASFGGA
jgi:hypothetical protein